MNNQPVRYSLSNDTWDEAEYKAIQQVVDSRHFTMGEQVAAFEKAFAAHFGAKYCVMSNSGSSANLLAVSALIQANRLSAGDEVLVPAVSWSTTYFPLSQYGLKLRLVDIDAHTLNLDITKLEAAVTPRTKAVMAVNLLGNPNDYTLLQDFCQAHGCIFMEDNCEAMGASFDGKKTGTFGIVGTFSTFYSHHICTMEGGLTVTDDEELYHIMLCMRSHGWTRHLPTGSPLYTKNQDAFYESFHFIMSGYNLRPLEMEGALGLTQLAKLDDLIATRRKNAADFQKKLENETRFYTQKETGVSSWFGFQLILNPQTGLERKKSVQALMTHGIEVRPIVAGNFARNPVVKNLHHSIAGSLDNADYIHDNGFFVGNHSVAMEDELSYLFQVLCEV